jgi:hypothetical protein
MPLPGISAAAYPCAPRVIMMKSNSGCATEELEEGFVPGVVWEAALGLEPTTYGLQIQFPQFIDVHRR